MASFKKYAEQFFESVEKLYVTIPGVEDGFGKDFLQIKKKADELKQDPTFACKSGQADENRKKNRYKDILPFDFARVKFTNYHGGSDYINASYIKRGKDAHCYIAAQGPLPHTVNDFWNMVWCCQVKVVVMVCKEIEMGRRKCERYWADEEERCKTFGEFTIEFMSSRQDNKDFLVRTLVVKFRNEKRTVIQFHYTAWPDHGVPKARASILQMIMEARREQSYETDTKQPLCIHCSAGCGRTGAVLVIDYFRHLLSIDRLEGTVFNVVMDMRRQRSSVVQTKEQYEFVHLAVVELLTNHIKDKQINCPENSVSRSVSNAHNYVNVQIQPDNRKHTSLAPIKASPTPEVKPRSSQYYGGGGGHLKSPSDVPPGKPSRNPADSRTAPGSRVTSFDSADGKSRPAVVYNKPQPNKIPPPKPSLVKRASSDSGPIPGTPSMMAQQKGSTFGYLNHGGYNKNADKYGKDSSQASAASSKPPMVGKVQLPALQEKFNIQTQQQNMATGDRSHHHHHHHARFVSASVLDLSEKSSQKQQQHHQHSHQQSTARMASASVQDLRSVEPHHHPKSTERNGSPFHHQPASNQATTPSAAASAKSFGGSFLTGKNTADTSKPDANKTGGGQSYSNGAYVGVTVKSPPPVVKPKPKPSVRRKPPAANKSESTPTTTATAASVQQQGKPLRFVNNLQAIRRQHFKATTTSTCSDKEVKRVALPRNHLHAATATTEYNTTASNNTALRRALKPETATAVTLSPPTPARRTHITSAPNQQQHPKAPVRYSNIIEPLTTPTTTQHHRPFSQLYPSSSSSKPLMSTDVSSKKRESTCSVPTAMTAAEKTSAAAANALPTSKKPQPVKPKRSVRAASSTTYAAQQQQQQQQQRSVPEGNSGGGRGTRSTVVSVADKPAEYETVSLDLPPKLPERTPESYRIVSEDEDDGVLEVGKGGGGGGGQIARYESLHVNPTTTSPARNHQPPPPSSQQQQNPSSMYATVTDVAPPVPPQSAPPLPVSSAPSVSTGGSLIPNTVTAPFKELASKFKNFAPSSLTGALTTDSQSKSMASLAKFTTPPNMATSIGIEQDMNFGNRYRRKPVGPRKQPEQWSSSKLL